MNTKVAEKIIIQVDAELKSLVPGYLEHRVKDVGLIHDAVSRGDFELIQHMAHILKGSGGGYGFDFISEIGDQMEEQAKEGDSGSISESLNELSHYLERVEVIYE